MENKDFKYKNLPNQLTIARVCAIPLFIVLLLMGFRVAATIVFLAPLADKLLTMSAFVCLVELGDIPGWMVIVILGREFIITGMRQVAAAEGIVIAAGWSGKIKTVCQMVAIPLIMLKNWPCSLLPFYCPLDQIMLWAALVMTIWSGAEYIIKNKQVFSMKNKS